MVNKSLLLLDYYCNTIIALKTVMAKFTIQNVD